MQTNIGISLCDCGKSLKNIDFELVREKAGELNGVIHVDVSSGLCLKEGLTEMVSTIREKAIDRVVIAACSPELKEALFRRTIEDAGLNSNLLSIANIREHCSWAHETDVTEKALELIGMAVQRVRLLHEIEKKEINVVQEVLIVGGGISGIQSALEISRLGLRTTLLEKEPTIGGKSSGAENPHTLEIMCSMGRAVEEDENIEVITRASVVKVEGDVGNFTVHIRRGEEKLCRTFGAVIFATGQMTDVSSAGFTHPSPIVSQHEFMSILQAPEKLLKRPKTIAFILDLADENPRLATLTTLKNALAFKEKLGGEVFVLCRNLKVDIEGGEALYRDTRNCRVVFLKFEEPPVIESCDDGRVRIEVYDTLLGARLTLFCDLLVIAGKALPSEETEAFNTMLKTGTDVHGFYQDENVHLYPVSSRRKGIFFVGSCRGDIDPARTLMDISSTAVNVYELLSERKVSLEVEKVKTEPDKCRACITCVRVCPHSAIRLVRIDDEREVAQICDLACDECGICTSLCPAKAIEFSGSSDEQISAEIEAAGEGNIIAFCCAESAYRAADRAGKLRIHSPVKTRVIQVPCVGRVDLLHILKAFEKKAAGVLVMGCQEGACQHLEGNLRAKAMVQYAQNLLEEIGIARERVKMAHLGPDSALDFTREISGMMEKIEEGKR